MVCSRGSAKSSGQLQRLVKTSRRHLIDGHVNYLLYIRNKVLSLATHKLKIVHKIQYTTWQTVIGKVILGRIEFQSESHTIVG